MSQMRPGIAVLRVMALAALIAAPLAIIPASAWTPPAVGQACQGMRGSGPDYAAIAGNYMGGRALSAGMVDRKSFQACFRSAAACDDWIARHAARYPLGPHVASCTRVVLR